MAPLVQRPWSPVPLLFLALAGPLVAADPGRIVNVRDHGARGDGRAHDGVALQAALDVAARAGGGTVVLPPGDYLSGSLRLGSDTTLRLEAGAILRASTNRADYAPGRSAHLLVADNARRIAVIGAGTIDGQGVADYGERWGVPEKPAFRTGILLFTGCQDLAVRDVTIRNSDAWTLHFKRCDDVTIDNVTIRNNYRRLNSDGIDPNMCRRVRITRCRITAGDDCIVLKTTEPYPCEDVEVSDCVLESAASALKLGTESKGDFRNIRFQRCVITNSPTGLGLYVKDGGRVENVTFSDLRISSSRTVPRTVTPVFLDIERRHADSKVGRIQNVVFENLTIESGSGILVQGMPEQPIEGLTFRQIRFRVPWADDYARRSKPVGGQRTTRDPRDTLYARLPSYFTVANVRDLHVEDVRVEIADAAFRLFERSAFCGRNLERGRILRVLRTPGPEAGSRPAIDLEQCREIRVEP